MEPLVVFRAGEESQAQRPVQDSLSWNSLEGGIWRSPDVETCDISHCGLGSSLALKQQCWHSCEGHRQG